MSRGPLGRTAALLFAVWFILSGAKPAGMDACPFHDGVAAAATAGAHAASTEHTGHGASHAVHAVHAASAAKGAPDADHSKHHCTCAGSCCCVTSIELPLSAQLTVRSIAAPHVAVATPTEYRADRVDFLLPFPTAPPHVSIA